MLQVTERNLIFVTHVGTIFVHSLVGIYIIYTARYILDPKYYIGVIVLTLVGLMFVGLLAFTIYYGGFTNNFLLMFEDDVELFANIRESIVIRRQQNPMNSEFYDAFNKIPTVIYENYLVLKNKT